MSATATVTAPIPGMWSSRKNTRMDRDRPELPTAVMALPIFDALTEKGGVLLVRQYRYAVDEETLEVCAGLVEKGEEPRDAAVREMQEELGFKPGKLTEIGRFYASPGFCTELLILYLAEELTPSRLPQDDDENVSVVELPLKDIPGRLAEGTFRDSKTFAAMAWLMAREGLRPGV